MIRHYSTFKKTKSLVRFCLSEPKIKSFDNSSEDSVTDKSHYRPSAPSYAQVSGSIRSGLYDFPDGIDNGIDVTFLRRRGVDELEAQAFIDYLKFMSDQQIKDFVDQSKLNKEKKKMDDYVDNANKAFNALSIQSNQSTNDS